MGHKVALHGLLDAVSVLHAFHYALRICDRGLMAHGVQGRSRRSQSLELTLICAGFLLFLCQLASRLESGLLKFVEFILMSDNVSVED